MLDCFMGGEWLYDYRKEVVSMNAQKYIWIERNIFTGGIPFLLEAFKIRKHISIVILDLIVYVRTLPRKVSLLFDVIVIFDARGDVELGMNPRQVVTLAIVLNSKLPVCIQAQ